jgi:hypothetical protein
MKRDWKEARAKVTKEGQCRYCRSQIRPLEAAHLIGRAADKKEGNKAIVNPLSVIPLCGPFGDSDSCHTKYDHHQLDILPYLTAEEEVQAVRDAATVRKGKGLAVAYRRLTGGKS